MSIVQFARILWSRSLIVLVATISALVGAYIVTAIAQPRFEATSRVMMSFLKPDAVTGKAIVGPKTIGPYVATQREIIRDYEVSARAAEALGWTSDPGLIAQYERRAPTDTRDFRRWLAQRVADRTNVKLSSGQVLEITYSSANPLEAKIAAEALRSAYLDFSLATRREEAAKNAAWWAKQADAARAAAEKAELAKASAEKAFGIVMAEGGDLDSERLRALSQAAAVPMNPSQVMTASGSTMQLAQIDAQISQLSGALGPNHPAMQELKNKRATMVAVIEQERALAQRLASGATSKTVIEGALQEQKARVLSQRDKVERLRQLDAEVDLLRQQYQKTAGKAADLSIEASASDTGMTPLGVVVTPTKPVFPNKPLILGGSLALGLAFGLVLALLIELLNRRVRGADDLAGSFDVPCLGIVDSGRGATRMHRLLDQLSMSGARKVVSA